MKTITMEDFRTGEREFLEPSAKEVVCALDGSKIVAILSDGEDQMETMDAPKEEEERKPRREARINRKR